MQEKSFEKVLNAHKKMKIALYLHDEQFIEGILLDVKKDHLVMDTGKEVLYFAISHIRALSKNAKYLQVLDSKTPYLVRNDMEDILIALRYNWVTINGTSKQTLFGVLRSIMDDHIMLVNNSELLYIPKEYIATIQSNLSIRDVHFINNRRQRTLQNLYKLKMGKRLFEQNGRFVSIKRHTDIQKYRVKPQQPVSEELPIEIIESAVLENAHELIDMMDEGNLQITDQFNQTSIDPDRVGEYLEVSRINSKVQEILDSLNKVELPMEMTHQHDSDFLEVKADSETSPTLRNEHEEAEFKSDSGEEMRQIEEGLITEEQSPQNYIHLLREEIRNSQKTLLDQVNQDPEFKEVLEPQIDLVDLTANQEEQLVPLANEELQSSEYMDSLLRVESIDEETIDGYFSGGESTEGINQPNYPEEQLISDAEIVNHASNVLEQEEHPVLEMQKDPVNVSEEIASNNEEKKQEQVSTQNEKPRQKEKRILLTAWSAINPDQSNIPLTKKSSKKIELPTLEGDLKEREPSSSSTNQHPNLSLEKDMKEEEIVNELDLAEDQEILETKKVLTPHEVKEMLEKQYYALMNFAASASLKEGIQSKIVTNTNSFSIQGRSDQRALNKAHAPIECTVEKEVLEKQFDSLMKHAAKMYRQLRDYQLDIIE